MDYEEFIIAYEEKDKALKDALKKLSSLDAKMQKNAEKGDYKSISKDALLFTELVASINVATTNLKETIDSFDSSEYFVTGAFTEDIINGLRGKAIDVTGEYPTLTVFPTKVTINADDQTVVIGKGKKESTARPLTVINNTIATIEKLNSGKFNVVSFAQDLENAYFTIIALSNEKGTKTKLAAGTYISLMDCYKILVPLARSRKDYDEEVYAFDLARLYNAFKSGPIELKSGRKIDFGTGREKKFIRILDSNGIEQQLNSVSFR